MRKTIRLSSILSLLLLLPAISFAQAIEVQLPFHAGRDYSFCLMQGTRQDTVQTGILDAGGRTIIDLSKGHPDYRGAGRLSVKGYGRIWNIVISDNETFTMSEPNKQEASPSFEGSAENTYLIHSLARQNTIIRDYHEAADAEQDQSQPQSYVLALPGQRMQGIVDEYRAFRREISGSPLYAARIMEILGCIAGAGGSFDAVPDDVLKGQREFVARKVNFNDLYTSGFWQPAFDVWYQAVSVNSNDSILLDDSRSMLDRCGDDIPIRRELAQTLIRLFSKYGRDYLLPALGTEYLTMPLNGQLTPQIVTADSTFLPRQSLIVFYETGCGNCHYELEQLKQKYKILTDNNIRVISIAADVDRDVFEETAASFPWADRLCDLKGFEGDNFRSYGIVGTPTFILTDSEGIVRGRYAQLKELLK